MTYYDAFDCKSNIEDFMTITPEEQEEVFRMIAEKNEALEKLPTSDQQAWEVEQDELKDWLGNYSNVDTGATYNGVAI
jgi:hypothetical protein